MIQRGGVFMAQSRKMAKIWPEITAGVLNDDEEDTMDKDEGRRIFFVS